jgi:hypothetical protein
MKDFRISHIEQDTDFLFEEKVWKVCEHLFYGTAIKFHVLNGNKVVCDSCLTMKNIKYHKMCCTGCLKDRIFNYINSCSEEDIIKNFKGLGKLFKLKSASDHDYARGNYGGQEDY